MLSPSPHADAVVPPALVAPIATLAAVQQAPTPRSLLVVDDEATLRSALRRFFVRRGWRVSEAVDGEEARAMLLDGDVPGGGFDAVLSDLRMPRLSGSALHDIVMTIDPVIGARFVFSTGDSHDDEAAAFIARTDCAVIPKPFELANLLALVERAAVATPRTH